MARSIDGKTVNFFNEFAAHRCVPDMTIFLDIGIEESFRRIDIRGAVRDRIELENESFFKKVRDGYRALADGNGRFFTVDGGGSVDEIHRKIADEFSARFFRD
jgi:dTMP kinase